MSRVQLALNVSDIGTAVDFYSKLFATKPNKLKPGYANFVIEEPPFKLVLIENVGATDSLNHLGVEVQTPGEVASAQKRLEEAGLTTANEDAVECCYALQDKVWVGAPDGEPWEIYTVLDDVEAEGALKGPISAQGNVACCGSVNLSEAASSGCC
jgi:catechol 2,3-dioxygenase-like lactoylglutathione lyase family enzyme